MELDGRTCLVTGANRGIGHAIASRLAEERVRLLVGVRELDRYEALEPRGPLRAELVKPVRIDLSSRESLEDSVAELGDELGRIDLLVNNAGEFTGGLLAETDLDEIYATVQANLTGWLHLTRRVLPQMLARGEGKIVNQSSIVAYAHFPGTTVYGATKAGVSAMTHSLRRELEDSGVTTLELITGGYDTGMLHSAAEQLERHTDPSRWEFRDPADWAEKVVEAIKSDKERLEPGGKSQLARYAAKAPAAVMDAIAGRGFDR
jgi:uncharacterized protein